MKLNRPSTMAATVVAVTLILGVAFATTASAVDIRYITISATGTTRVVPDAVRINATISVLGTTSKEALSTTGKTSSAVRLVLSAKKVVAKDIATQSITVYPEYSYPAAGTPTIFGYRATQSFEIIIRSTISAGDIVEAIVDTSGENLQVNGVTPFILNDLKANETARTAAVNKAKAKASSYAKLLGVKLGRVIYLDETLTPSPYPTYTTVTKSDSPIAIDLGEQSVSVSVIVRWAIK